MIKSEQKRKGWIIYATLFELSVELFKNINFIDIYTSIDYPYFLNSKGIFILYKDYNPYLEYKFIKNRFYFDKKVININKNIYTIYHFKLNNSSTSVKNKYISDSLLEKYYDYSLYFSANHTLEYFRNKIIENCCRLNYYEYNKLLEQDGYENILKQKAGLYQPFLFYLSSPII